MRQPLTKDETIRAIAELIAGLGVPVSLRLPLGTAREPWGRLYDLCGGWASADEFEVALHQIFDAPEKTTPTLP